MRKKRYTHIWKIEKLQNEEKKEAKTYKNFLTQDAFKYLQFCAIYLTRLSMVFTFSPLILEKGILKVNVTGVRAAVSITQVCLLSV